MALNFYNHLKKNKVLCVTGTQFGGIPTNTGGFEPITPTTPCKQQNGYDAVYVNKYVITFEWDQEADNGLVNVIIDEFFTNTTRDWNRSLAVGAATPSSISINQSGVGITRLLTSSPCKERFYLVSQAAFPNTGLELNSSDGKIITLQEAQTLVGCAK